MNNLWDRFAIGWCRRFHSRTSWPIRGHYECLTCQRTYPVPWFEGEKYARKEVSKESYTRAGFVELALQKSRG